MKARFTYWKEKDGWYLGYLNDYPDHWTQGENLEDLKEHLKDLFQTFGSPAARYSSLDWHGPQNTSRRNHEGIHASVSADEGCTLKAGMLQVLPQFFEGKGPTAVRGHQHVHSKKSTRHRARAISFHHNVANRNPSARTKRLEDFSNRVPKLFK